MITRGKFPLMADTAFVPRFSLELFILSERLLISLINCSRTNHWTKPLTNGAGFVFNWNPTVGDRSFLVEIMDVAYPSPSDAELQEANTWILHSGQAPGGKDVCTLWLSYWLLSLKLIVTSILGVFEWVAHGPPVFQGLKLIPDVYPCIPCW